MDSEHIVVLITAPSPQVGEQVAKTLLENKLAACVNLLSSIRSLYTWEGQICDDQEVLLIVKSRAELFTDQLVPTVQAIHPYEVPEIIALPIAMGSHRYLSWIDETTA
jgi:periplasmic divalent cation tolerance protein